MYSNQEASEGQKLVLDKKRAFIPKSNCLIVFSLINEIIKVFHGSQNLETERRNSGRGRTLLGAHMACRKTTGQQINGRKP